MTETVPSTLLLYPEWIIWITILFTIINLIATVVCLTLIGGLHGKIDYEHTAAYRELEAWKIKYRELWTAHEERRDKLTHLAAEHRKLTREYDELWQEHQDTCSVLGAMLPEEET